MEAEFTKAPEGQLARHAVYFAVTEKTPQAVMASLASDERVGGLVVFGAALPEMRHPGPRVVDLTKIEHENGVYELNKNSWLVDRGLFSCDRYSTPAELKKALAGKEGEILVRGELMSSLAFRSPPTRADVGDIYNLCAAGAHGLVIDADAVPAERIPECVQAVYETLLVFEGDE